MATGALAPYPHLQLFDSKGGHDTTAPSSCTMRLGLGQGSVDRPPMLAQTLGQRWIRHAQVSRPLWNGACLAMKSDTPGTASVVRLLARRGPAAIARTVWAIVIDSIERATRRTRTHVSKEGRKAVPPPRIHHDTATTIRHELRMVWVVAPTLGAFPCLVFCRPGTAMGQVHRSQAVTIPTATAFNLSRFQLRSRRGNHTPAFTTTPPMGFTSTRTVFTKNSQSFECAMGDVC